MKEFDKDFVEMACYFHVVEQTAMRVCHPYLFFNMYFVLEQFSVSFNTKNDNYVSFLQRKMGMKKLLSIVLVVLCGTTATALGKSNGTRVEWMQSHTKFFAILLERFSFECRKVIGFAFTTQRDWLKKLAPLFHPIRSKTKTNRDSLARVFPRFVSATCNYFVF